MDEIKLSFEEDTISFGNTSLSFENDKLSFGTDVSASKPKKDIIVEQPKVTSESRWLTEDEARTVVTWLKQIVSYNLRNDITSYAKDVLNEVNTASISYNELHSKLERLKNTFNAVAKRRGRL